jgi:hypothetical protein
VAKKNDPVSIAMIEPHRHRSLQILTSLSRWNMYHQLFIGTMNAPFLLVAGTGITALQQFNTSIPTICITSRRKLMHASTRKKNMEKEALN